jgi:hypothetical protein
LSTQRTTAHLFDFGNFEEDLSGCDFLNVEPQCMAWGWTCCRRKSRLPSRSAFGCWVVIARRLRRLRRLQRIWAYLGHYLQLYPDNLRRRLRAIPLSR